MKNLYTLGLATLSLAVASPAAAQECAITFSVEYGCHSDELGWAAALNVENAAMPYGFIWSTGDVTQYVDAIPNGDHWLTILDANGCSHKVDFVVDCVKDEEPDEPCELRTQTPGGWGAPANGNNPGAYRDAHFGEAFPGGLVIGCTNTLTLTSAAAVEAFLPSGTQPRALNASYVDPGNSYKNVLAGHLVALTLSVGFDLNDPDFGSGGMLADAVINNGMFQGWTVAQLLDEANSFIGGCGSSYSASQLNNALAMVNQNFVDGTVNNGNLDCDGEGMKKSLAIEAFVQATVRPNPAVDVLTVDVIAATEGNVSIELVDALGRTVKPVIRTHLLGGEQRTITIDVNDLQNGTYLLMMQQGEKAPAVQRIVVNH